MKTPTIRSKCAGDLPSPSVVGSCMPLPSILGVPLADRNHPQRPQVFLDDFDSASALQLVTGLR